MIREIHRESYFNRLKPDQAVPSHIYFLVRHEHLHQLSDGTGPRSAQRRCHKMCAENFIAGGKRMRCPGARSHTVGPTGPVQWERISYETDVNKNNKHKQPTAAYSSVRGRWAAGCDVFNENKKRCRYLKRGDFATESSTTGGECGDTFFDRCRMFCMEGLIIKIYDVGLGHTYHCFT